MRKWQICSGKTRETYLVWRDMRRRCYNPKCKKFPDYGGRGITVCDRWRDNYDAFYADMGQRPPGLTLERVDNDQGYDPFNCIWATYSTQNYNKRNHNPAQHGTRSKYNVGCRCEDCRTAKRNASREQRKCRNPYMAPAKGSPIAWMRG